MPASRPSARTQVLAALAVTAIALIVVLATRGSASTTVPPRPFLASMFQDDDHLLYAPRATVVQTLDVLRRLGVDQVRATVLWKNLAPGAGSTVRPAGFSSTDPASYPAAAWRPYDRLVELAQARGIAVDFVLSAPGPLWAMAPGEPGVKYADHWAPSAVAFGRFSQAVARRYSGRYVLPGSTAPLPRVTFWSIWNEPNQPGWLTPQWRPVSGQPVMESAALYRAYVDAAFAGLSQGGHTPASDTILIGELAPEGSVQPSYTYRDPIPPLPFLRAVYCVDPSFHPLTGPAATGIGCPSSGSRSAFVAAHPALFEATGLGHHPYSFFLTPSTSMSDPGFAPLSDLGRLEQEIDAIFAAYEVSRRLPLYLTEYGYETDPPNPWRGVSLRLQSLYLNEAQYMAWRDPRVLSMSQFLLYDALPDSSFPPGSQKYWSTFQTGLRFASGQNKPSFSSYRLPLFVPDPVLRADGTVLVWGMVRAAPHDSVRQPVQLEWRTQTARSFQGLTTVSSQNPDQVFVARIHLPGPGVLRAAWTGPSGRTIYSRGVGVRSG